MIGARGSLEPLVIYETGFEPVAPGKGAVDRVRGTREDDRMDEGNGTGAPL